MNIDYNNPKWRFLIEAGKPYAGSTQSVWDAEADRVLWSASFRPELGRNLTLAEFEAAAGVKFDALALAELRAKDHAYETTLITGPREITEAEFMHALEVLPPARRTRHKGVEFFHVSERVRGSIVSWYGRRNGKFYTFNDRAGRSIDDIADKFGNVATYDAIERACLREDAGYTRR